MKFKSALVTQASGSIGGLTAARNRGGMYIRSRSMPVNPSTSQQQAVRGFFGDLAARWVTVLTDTQRDEWLAYAQAVLRPDALGDDRQLTALNWYQACNVPRLQAGLAVVDDAPTIHAMAALTEPSIDDIDVPNQEIDIAFSAGDTWAGAVGGALLVYTSPGRNPSVNYYRGPYRFAGAILGAVMPPTSPATLSLSQPVAAGQVVHVQVRSVTADGRISSVQRFRGLAS